ncbi:unnamed protein product [Musa banksii]
MVPPSSTSSSNAFSREEMASGWGITGNDGRCCDFSDCVSRCREPKCAPSSATTTWSVSTTPKSNQSLAAGGYHDLYKLKGVEKNWSNGLIGCGSYVRECPPRDKRYP